MNTNLKIRAKLYTLLYYYLGGGFFDICFDFKAMASKAWNEWFKENLDDLLLNNIIHHGDYCVVFKCRTPFKKTYETHCVWISASCENHCSEILSEYELSQFKIVYGPPLIKDKTYKDTEREIQDGFKEYSFQLAASSIKEKKRQQSTEYLTETGIFNNLEKISEECKSISKNRRNFEVTFSIGKKKKTYTVYFTGVLVDDDGNAINLELHIQRKLKTEKKIHIYEIVEFNK